VAALNDIKPAITKKGDDDLQNKVIFTGQDAVAYGEGLVLVVPYATDFATVAPSTELIEMLRKVKADKVSFDLNAKNQLVLQAGKVKTVLKTEPDNPLLSEITTGLMAEVAAAEWYNLPDGNDLGKAIKACMYSASKDNTQPELACVRMVDNMVIASDDYRVSKYVLPFELAGEMLIRAEYCAQMVKFTFTQYAITDTWALFNTADNKMLAAKRVNAEYGDIEQFLTFEGTDYVLPDDIVEQVKQVAVLAAGDHDIEKEILVTLSPGTVTLRAEREVGFAEAVVTSDVLEVATPVAFTINPIFFADTLAAMNNTINLGDDKAIFKQDTFTHLISLSILDEA